MRSGRVVRYLLPVTCRTREKSAAKLCTRSDGRTAATDRQARTRMSRVRGSVGIWSLQAVELAISGPPYLAQRHEWHADAQSEGPAGLATSRVVGRAGPPYCERWRGTRRGNTSNVPH